MKKFLAIFTVILGMIFTFTGITKAATMDVPHWKKSTISVYIPKDDKQITMRHAFEKWEKSLDGKIKFSYVPVSRADIVVSFTDSVDGSDGPLGQYSITVKNKEIIKAEIQIASNSKNIKNYSKDYIYTTMLHEIGHVLGLEDNKRHRTCIMAMPISEIQDISKTDLMRLYYINKWIWSNRRINN